MKKNFYLVLVLVTCSAIAHAQIKKGASLIGGNISFSSTTTKQEGQSTDNSKVTSFYVAPSYGKAIKDNLILGFDLDYALDKNLVTSSNYQDLKNSSYGAGVFLRKYQYLGAHFYFFGQSRLGGDYISGKTLYNQGSDFAYKNRAFDLNLSLYPGISYAINDKWQLETGFPNLVNIGYTHSRISNDYPNGPAAVSTNSFNLSSSLSSTYQLSVGMRVLIN